MRAPGFWQAPPERPGLWARLLWPASLVWRVGAWLRAWRARPWRASVPVVCVGNATVGGTGKTPLVAALAARLAAAGAAPHILSRGHGGRLRGPHRVDAQRDGAADVGDEPLMLAATTPVWVSRDRAAGARAAAEAGAGVILMDDGAQNPDLVKDATVLVVDAEAGFGNARLVPAGPLREPAEAALARADLVVLVGSARARARALERWPLLAQVHLTGAEIAPAATGLRLDGLPVVAFAGIGRPEKFFATLEDLGARVLAAHPFPDHHRYPPAVFRRMLREARTAGAMLVTTEKDAARLPPDQRREIMAVPVRLAPEDWAPLDGVVALARRRATEG